MHFLRRIVGSLVVALALFGTVHAAVASEYPVRAITIVVPYSAGTGIDVATRLFAEKLHHRSGVPVVIENKTGAGGNLGTAYVVNSNPDGYTLLLAANTLAINPSFYKLPFNAMTSLAAVGMFAQGTMVLVVNPSVEAKNLNELIALAKKNPGKLNYGSSGLGTPQHLAMELLKKETGTDIFHIPHRGQAEAMTEVLRGGVEVVIAPLQTALPYITSGRLRALAITSVKRDSIAPEIPTMSEALGFGEYNVNLWYGLFAPVDTPKPVVDFLGQKLKEILALPDVRTKFGSFGMHPDGSGAAELKRLLEFDTKRWAETVQSAGIKAVNNP